jgi:hypothetical protein
MYFIYDVYLVSGYVRSEVDLLSNVPNLINASIRSPVNLNQVQGSTIGDSLANTA